MRLSIFSGFLLASLCAPSLIYAIPMELDALPTGTLHEPFAKSNMGIHVEFTGNSVASDCETVWDAMKTYNWPDLSSLESFGGAYWPPITPDKPCHGYKNVYGSPSEVQEYVKGLGEFASDFVLLNIEVRDTQITGYFKEYESNGFYYSFDRSFKTFDELIAFRSDYMAAQSASLLLDFLRKYFDADEYEQRLAAFFTTGSCLKEYSMRWDVVARDETTGAPIKIASKLTGMDDICP
jgi:hypothetical protein